jgi:osmotically-inducible protein OsmY
MEGQVEQHSQRVAAETVLRHLRGVRGVKNQIAVRASVTPDDIKERIVAALDRSAAVDADGILVEVSGHKLTLTGKARTLREREEAERAACRAPGVAAVENRLAVAAYPGLWRRTAQKSREAKA